MSAHRRAGAHALAWLSTHPGVRRVLRTFVYAFLGLLIPGLLGFLGEVTEWANAAGATPFPDAWSLAYVGVSAIAAGTVAVVNALGIWLENATGRTFLRPED